MKKLAAILCATAMTFGMIQSAAANPNIHNLMPEEATQYVEVARDSEFTSEQFKGMDVYLKNSDEEEYLKRNEDIAEAIRMLLDKEDYYTTQQVMEMVGIEFSEKVGYFVHWDGTEKKFLTNKDNHVNPSVTEPLTSFSNSITELGEFLENGQLEATIPSCEALVGLTQKDVLILQLNEEALNKAPEDLEEGEELFYLVELEDMDSQTGEFTAQFPSTGPFIFLTMNGNGDSFFVEKEVFVPSIGAVTVLETEENVNVVENSEYNFDNLKELQILVRKCEAEDYLERNENIARAIEMLLDPEETYTVRELMETVGADFTTTDFFTTDGQEIDPEELEPIISFSKFVNEKKELIENGQLEAVIPSCEALVGMNREDIVIIQFDEEILKQVEEGLAEPEDAIYLIIPDEINEETGGFTAKFPCTGPFFVTVRA